jgi:hypothetical protein
VRFETKFRKKYPILSICGFLWDGMFRSVLGTTLSVRPFKVLLQGR